MSLLYVLPHAGGAAHSYNVLRDALASQIEVRCLELPGRGRRAKEPGLTTWEAAIEDVLQLIDPPAGRPWGLFGHSMGSLLGVEALRRRSEGNGSRPVFFAASGSPAPAARKRTRIAHLPGEAFWTEIERYGGVPAEIMAVPEFREYFESILRLDFGIIENGPHSVAGRIDLPVHVFYGDRDMTGAEAASWKQVTTGPTHFHEFPGDHFFLFDHLSGVAARIAAAFGSGA